MKILDYFLAIFFLAVLALSFLKVFLFLNIKETLCTLIMFKKNSKLQNQNSKLNVEIALLKSSPYIYDNSSSWNDRSDIDDE